MESVRLDRRRKEEGAQFGHPASGMRSDPSADTRGLESPQTSPYYAIL
jgi:hypothetical protein